MSKVSEIKLKPLRKIEFNSNLNELNNLVKNNKDRNDKYLFITNKGRWDGFIDDEILKAVSVKKWPCTFVGDFKKPINNFSCIYSHSELWKIIEKIEKTNRGLLLVLNAADIPLGIIDRNRIGYFVFNKLGLNLPKDIMGKFNNKNHYPLGLELPRIVKIMKMRGDIE